MKKLFLIFLAALTVLSLAACNNTLSGDLKSVSGGYIQAGDEKLTPEYVVEIDGKKVSFDEYRHFFLNLKSSMEYESGKSDLTDFWTEENIQKLKEQTLEFILNAYALEKYAQENSLSLTDEEKAESEQYVDSIISNLGNEEFNNNLQVLNLTEKLFYELQEEEVLYEKIYNHLFGEGGELAWTEEEYQQYYNENYICATHILIDFVAGENAENCPETMKKAQEIYQKTASEDFNTLIKEYGKDENLENYPTGYYFTKGDMVESFYNAAASLEINGVAAPVITNEGCHIIKRLQPDKEQVALQKDNILWGSTQSDGSYTMGIYAQEFEAFYTGLSEKYLTKVTYNPEIEAYLKPDLVF